MTPEGNKPSADDIADNIVEGYGVITNIINGGVECGNGPTQVRATVTFWDNLDVITKGPLHLLTSKKNKNTSPSLIKFAFVSSSV